MATLTFNSTMHRVLPAQGASVILTCLRYTCTLSCQFCTDFQVFLNQGKERGKGFLPIRVASSCSSP